MMIYVVYVVEDSPTIAFTSQEAAEAWLQENHAEARSIWRIKQIPLEGAR